MRLKPWFFVLVTLALVLIPSNGVFGSPRQKSDEAYVTLLYGDEFLLGVRVLGKSIRDTRSTKDMVVLVSDGVSDYAMKLLEVNFCSSHALSEKKNSALWINLFISSLCFSCSTLNFSLW